MAGFDNDVVYGSNVDFTGANPVTGQMTANGQLLIGASVAPFIRAATPTNGTNISWTLGAGTIQANVSGPPAVTNLTNHGVVIGHGTTAMSATTAGTANQVLQSQGASSDPTWSTATYPATTTANQLLYSSAANTVAGLTSANNSALVTDGSGVPSLGTSLSNNFTYTSSTAGATRTLTVSNTDNTNAASTALIQTTTGGASSGDPLHTFTITGATSWSYGVDNSDSDAFVISQGTALGTNNIFRSSTAGEINYPLQPAFLATSAGASNVTGDGTAYTVVFGNEIFDQNSDFDGTSTFTAPVTGRYRLSATVDSTGVTASHTTGDITLVTSNRSYSLFNLSYAAVRSSTNVVECGGGALADMDAADTATVTLTVSGGTKVVSTFTGFTNFSGSLIA